MEISELVPRPDFGLGEEVSELVPRPDFGYAEELKKLIHGFKPHI